MSRFFSNFVQNILKMKKIVLFLLLLPFCASAQNLTVEITSKYTKAIAYSVDSTTNPGYYLLAPVDTLKVGDQATLIYPISTNNNNFNYAITDKGTCLSINNLLTATGLNLTILDWIKNFTFTPKVRPEPVKVIDTSFAGQQASMQASMKMMSQSQAWHKYLTIFTGEIEFNGSHQALLDFLQHHMNMTEASQDVKNGYIISKVKQSVSKGNPETLTIKYKVKTQDGFYFPESVEITGTNRTVIMLFVSYWPAKLQFDDIKKGEQAYCYMLPDKITLSVDKAGNAKIKITNTQN